MGQLHIFFRANCLLVAALSSSATPISCHLSEGASPQFCADSDAANPDEGEESIFLQHSLHTDLGLRENVSVAVPVGSPSHGNFSGTDMIEADGAADMTSIARQGIYNSVMGWFNASLPLNLSQFPFYMADILPEKEKGLDHWETADTIAIVTVMLLFIGFDVFIAPRIPPTMANHLLVLAFMVLQSAAFCALVCIQRGRTDCIAWATGFVVEIALSMDNLFVFHLVFQKFKVVQNDRVMRALSFGIYGAVLLRVLFILLLTRLFEIHYSIDITIGALLILSGIMTLQDDDDDDVADLYTVKFFQWIFGNRLRDPKGEETIKLSLESARACKSPRATKQSDCRLFAEDESGRTQITILCLVICIISVVDVFFAVDSVGSKTGQIRNVFINLSSSLLAMFCLRALYFIVKDLNDFFDYVKYGICAILCFVGLEMIVSKWYDVSLATMCAVIATLFLFSVLASIAKVAVYGVDKDGENDA